jgi:uncharacterized membrane protein YjgN (DUF898 family)
MYALLPGRAYQIIVVILLVMMLTHRPVVFLSLLLIIRLVCFSSWTVARTGLLWQRRTCGYVGISNGAT